MRIISLAKELKKKKASGSLIVHFSCVSGSQHGTWPKKYAVVFMELNSDLTLEHTQRHTPSLQRLRPTDLKKIPGLIRETN